MGCRTMGVNYSSDMTHKNDGIDKTTHDTTRKSRLKMDGNAM